VLDLYFNKDPELKSFKRMQGSNLTPQEKLQKKMEELKSLKSKHTVRSTIKKKGEEEGGSLDKDKK
jgi:hypothetical protein